MSSHVHGVAGQVQSGHPFAGWQASGALPVPALDAVDQSGEVIATCGEAAQHRVDGLGTRRPHGHTDRRVTMQLDTLHGLPHGVEDVSHVGHVLNG